MTKHRRLTLQLAGVGLGVTATLYAAFFLAQYLPRLLFEMATLLLGLISIVFCPASLCVVQPFAIVELPQSIVSDHVTWVIVGLMNSACYAVVGNLTMRLMSRTGKPKIS